MTKTPPPLPMCTSGKSSYPALPVLSSGINVTPEAKAAYEEVRTQKKHRFVILYINGDNMIDVEHAGPRDSTYEDFLQYMKNVKDHCRYCIFDYPAKVGDDKLRGSSLILDRIVLMSWCPENSNVKQKMLYSSSCEALKKCLRGVHKFVQACDFDDLSLQAMEDHFKRLLR